MNFNVWNIKDMLNMPSNSGTNKPSNWNNNQTDYSSLSDSQFLFGSQFCPESSETLTAPLDFGVHLRHPRQTQQNSLDSEPSIFTKYQTKPQLFGGDTKDGELFPPPLSVGKSKSLLEQFEEKKKMAKDKCDSEILYNFISHVRESIHMLQTSVEKSEEHLSSRSQSILDSLETMAKTLQETARVQNVLVSETAQDNGNVEKAILEMQKVFEAQRAEFVEMKSSLSHLESVVAQQSKDFQQLCERLSQLNLPAVLEELKKLITGSGVLRHVKDSTCQTLPPLTHSIGLSRQDKHACEESALWQSPTLSDVSLSMNSLKSRKFGARGQGSESDALQEEATLLETGSSEGNRRVKDKAVQTNCQNWAITKTSSETHDSNIPGHKVPGDKDLAAQGASYLTTLDLNDSVVNIKNTCQNHQDQDVSLWDPCGQKLVTEQKSRTVETRRKGKKKQPRKTLAGRFLDRKPKQTRRNTCVLNSNPLPSSSKRTPQRQQELLDLWDPTTCKKSVCPLLHESSTPRPGRESDGSQNSSSQRNNHISWFSGIKLGSSESPLGKEAGKNLLYDLGFDSSDDGF